MDGTRDTERIGLGLPSRDVDGTSKRTDFGVVPPELPPHLTEPPESSDARWSSLPEDRQFGIGSFSESASTARDGRARCATEHWKSSSLRRAGGPSPLSLSKILILCRFLRHRFFKDFLLVLMNVQKELIIIHRSLHCS